MNPLDVVKFTALMEGHRGSADIYIGLIDGPVVQSHPDLTSESIRELPGGPGGRCSHVDSAACLHGTFVAGVLKAKRSSTAPGICPDCTLLVRPIFAETTSGNQQMPSARPEELAAAIVESIAAGAHVLNMSAALVQPSAQGERALQAALDYAAQREVLAVAAAGNQGMVGSSLLTRHPWVIPVAACDLQGRPIHLSNLGHSIGKRGLSAPGDGVTSLGADGKALISGGTSVAAPFVTGAIALLWSAFPVATAAQVKLALTQGVRPRRPTLIPPLLDAWAAYQALAAAHGRK